MSLKESRARLKIIHRSVLKELFFTFFLTLAFLNSVLMMEKLLRLSRLLSGVGATVYDMARIILLLQPQILLLTIPMSLLLSTLLVYGRMNHDSEITILRVSGMDFMRISFPVVLLGLFCFLSSLAVSFYFGPVSSSRLRNEITKIITVRSSLAIEEGTFNTSFKDIVILVKGRRDRETLSDIFIYDNRSKEQPRVLIAKEGKIFVQDGDNIGLYLRDGYINISKGKNTTELFFEKYKMVLNLDAESQGPKKMEFTPLQLVRKTRYSEGKERASYYLEFHRRLSLPAVCLILIFLGPPLSLLAGKAGRLGGLAIGLLVFTFFYMTLIYGENLVMSGRVPHYVGAWLATAVLAAFAAFAFRREQVR